ncbi:hypothetical protein MTO96_022941 [Rhipicephalus appendiculatus]
MCHGHQRNRNYVVTSGYISRSNSDTGNTSVPAPAGRGGQFLFSMFQSLHTVRPPFVGECSQQRFVERASTCDYNCGVDGHIAANNSLQPQRNDRSTTSDRHHVVRAYTFTGKHV